MKRFSVILTSAVLVIALASPAFAGWSVRVKGPGRAHLTWGNIESTNQATRALPWRHRVRVQRDFDVVSVLAQRTSGGSGTIRCQVVHNGNVVSRSRASGPYAICSASQAT
jgi:hypothetical protein